MGRGGSLNVEQTYRAKRATGMVVKVVAFDAWRGRYRVQVVRGLTCGAEGWLSPEELRDGYEPRLSLVHETD